MTTSFLTLSYELRQAILFGNYDLNTSLDLNPYIDVLVKRPAFLSTWTTTLKQAEPGIIDDIEYVANQWQGKLQQLQGTVRNEGRKWWSILDDAIIYTDLLSKVDIHGELAERLAEFCDIPGGVAYELLGIKKGEKKKIRYFSMVAGETLYPIVAYNETTEEFVEKIRDLKSEIEGGRKINLGGYR
jgi:hypothetical protein